MLAVSPQEFRLSMHQCFRIFRRCFFALLALAAANHASAQAGTQTGRIYTDADYQRAVSMLNDAAAPLVDHAVTEAHTMADDRFWYIDVDHGLGTPMLVNSNPATRAPLYDPTPMAASLHTAGLPQADPRKVTPTEITLVDKDTAALLSVDGGKYRCTLGAPYTCSQVQPAASTQPGPLGRRNTPDAVLSPDGRRAAYIRDWNLWIRDIPAGTEHQLTTDGVKDFGYATDNSGWLHTDRAVALWAPDSRHIATFQQDQRRVGDFYMLTSEVGHPKLEQWKYPMVGDKDVITIQRVIIDADTATTVRLQMPPDNHRSTICDDVSCNGGWDDVQWATDSQTLAFVSTSRDHKLAQVRIATAGTGAVRDVLDERVPTFFESGYTSVNWRYLSERDEILWWSQRSNWGSLYLYSAKDGRLLHPVTTGNWNVEQIYYIDQQSGSMLLTGSGREHGSGPDTDPYYRRIYSTNLDGKSITLVSAEDADHTLAAWSPHGHYLVDIYSTPQAPQTAVLRDRTGKVLLTLATGDVTRLKATGWQAPETFRVKGHDGSTDVYGLLFRPAHLDPAKKYPVIDFIYPGPFNGSFISAGGHGFRAARGDLNALPELGFAVVAIEGMGNPHRSKIFQDTYIHDIGVNAVPDQISGLKDLAARFPWIDLDRTGMYGHSGGGNATAATMFRYPGFIKVGIAESGNHDNRDYEDDWDEKYVGLVEHNADGTTNYDTQANAQYAKNLQGKLLLAHGMLDDNVPVENTMLLVDALQKANKSFDLILFPRAHHGYGDMAYYMMRRRWDYFVTNLMGGTPPINFQMPPAPGAAATPAKPAPLPAPKH